MRREYFEVSERNILLIIERVHNDLKQGESMEKIRDFFEEGEEVGNKFVLTLYSLYDRGWIKNITFVPPNDPQPEEAVWSNVELTQLGRQFAKTFKG